MDLTAQPVSLDDLDDYISDEDMSDDAGAPLMSYVDILNLLVNGMDSEHNMAPSDLDADLDPDIDNPSELGEGDQGYQTAQSSAYQPSDDNDDLANLDQPIPAGLPNTLLPQQPQPALTAAETLATLEDSGPAISAAGSEWLDAAHPLALSNPNPTMLGPGNYGLTDFLHRWARQSRPTQAASRERGRFPWPNKINELAAKEVARVRYDDLGGDRCDMQGIDWRELGVSRSEARERRLLTYNNYVNNEGSDRWTVSSLSACSPMLLMLNIQ